METEDISDKEGILREISKSKSLKIEAIIGGLLLGVLGIVILVFTSYDKVLVGLITLILVMLYFVGGVIAEIRLRYWDTKYYMFKYFRRDLK